MKIQSYFPCAALLFAAALAIAAEPTPTTKKWELSFPDATASLGACVVDGHLYVHGGHTGATHQYSRDNHSKHFLRVNLSSPEAKWEKLPVETNCQGFGMVAHAGRIYRIGGSQATNAKDAPSNLRSLASCSVFDTKTKKWSKLPPLPSPRSSHDAAVSDGKLYVTGGWDMGNGKEGNDRWHYHGLVADLKRSPLKWEKLPPTNWAVRAHATEVFSGKLYVAGGIDANGTSNTVNVLDLKTRQWSIGPEYPGQGRTKSFGMALCVWNGQLIANSYSSKVRRLTSSRDGWELIPAYLQERRFFHRMVPADNRLLFVAGANFEKHLSDIEQYTPSLKPNGSRWPGFRGDGTSISQSKDLPLKWSDKANILWRNELPGYGQSSPVVWDGKIFTTSTLGKNCEKVIVHCTSLVHGKELWSKSFNSSLPAERSRMISQAAPSPVVDSSGLYVFFESGDLLSMNHNGELRWHRNLGETYGKLRTHHGLGSSLFQSTNYLGLLLDHPDPSYLLCLDKQTGKTLWANRRDKRVSWATPALVDNALLISSNGLLEEIDFDTGKRRWFVDGLTGNTVASATVADDLVITGSSAKGNCLAVRRGGSGNVAESHVVWKATEATSSFGSPLVYDGYVYFVSRAGVLNCVDLKSGEQKWDQRLGASCWASPIAAEGRIYFFNKEGSTVVLPAGGHKEPMTKNTLTIKGVLYSVAAVDNNFVVRTGSELICITKNKK